MSDELLFSQNRNKIISRKKRIIQHLLKVLDYLIKIDYLLSYDSSKSTIAPPTNIMFSLFAYQFLLVIPFMYVPSVFKKSSRVFSLFEMFVFRFVDCVVVFSMQNSPFFFEKVFSKNLIDIVCNAVCLQNRLTLCPITISICLKKL